MSKSPPLALALVLAAVESLAAAAAATAEVVEASSPVSGVAVKTEDETIVDLFFDC